MHVFLTRANTMVSVLTVRVSSAAIVRGIIMVPRAQVSGCVRASVRAYMFVFVCVCARATVCSWLSLCAVQVADMCYYKI